MRLRLRSQSSLLTLLLRLEWLLLGVVAITEIIVSSAANQVPWRVGNGLGILLFAAMGLGFPQRSHQKWLYTALEFVLILLLALVGGVPLFQLLFLVLVLRNCLLLERRNRSIITGGVFFANTLCQTHRLFYRSIPFNFPLNFSLRQVFVFWLGSVLIFGLVILFLQLLVDIAMMERQGQEKLAIAHTRLQHYALQVEELATVQERNRIARDLHDSLGHSLTVFNLHLGAAIRLIHTNPTEAEALLKEIQQLGSRALAEVSQSVAMLRADPLAGQDLAGAIALLVDQFHRTTGVLPNTKITLTQPLPHQYNLTIYRIVQEGVTNISKHAAATQIDLHLEKTATGIRVELTDNGRGFEPEKNTTGFGLRGMRERVWALGGTLDLLTSPGQGCRIIVSLPPPL